MKPEELALDKTGIINETITSVLEGKYTHKKNQSACSTLEAYKKTLFLFLWALLRMWLNWSHRNFFVVKDLEVWTWKIYRGCMLKFR